MNIYKLLTLMYNLVAQMNPSVRAILFFGSLLTTGLTYLNEVWGELFQRIDGLAAAAAGTADFSPLSLVNYCVPLDVMLDMIVAYGVLRLACAGIRIIKSFIPTVS